MNERKLGMEVKEDSLEVELPICRQERDVLPEKTQSAGELLAGMAGDERAPDVVAGNAEVAAAEAAVGVAEEFVAAAVGLLDAREPAVPGVALDI